MGEITIRERQVRRLQPAGCRFESTVLGRPRRHHERTYHVLTTSTLNLALIEQSVGAFPSVHTIDNLRPGQNHCLNPPNLRLIDKAVLGEIKYSGV